jgi:K+-transporting ATPase KdpF subunit
MTLIEGIGLALAVLLLGYLFVALMKPESF